MFGLHAAMMVDLVLNDKMRPALLLEMDYYSNASKIQFYSFLSNRLISSIHNNPLSVNTNAPASTVHSPYSFI